MSACPTALGATWAPAASGGWNLRRIKDVASIVNGYPFDSEKFEVNGVHPLVRIRDLNTDGTSTRYSGDWVEDAAIEAGDVLVGMDGDFNVGVWNGGRALLNQRVCCVRGETPLLNRFLAYALPMPLKVINELTYFTTVKHLSSLDVERITVATPPSPLLAPIVKFLDEQTAKIDMLISEKERLVASLKDIEEVTAFDLVTRGVRPGVKRSALKEEWLREVPANWEIQKLRNLATIGNGSTPKRDNDAYWKGGTTAWLNSGSVNAARICEASDYVTAVAQKECHLPMVRAGSTVVALTGQGKTRGSASLTELATTISQHLAYLSLSDTRMADEYLWVTLTGLYSVLRYLSDGEGSTKGALTCEQLNQLRVPVPPLTEQAEIVATYKRRVSAIEGLRAHAVEHLSRLREYRSSLISAAVTGQLDVSTFKVAA